MLNTDVPRPAGRNSASHRMLGTLTDHDRTMHLAVIGVSIVVSLGIVGFVVMIGIELPIVLQAGIVLVQLAPMLICGVLGLTERRRAQRALERLLAVNLPAATMQAQVAALHAERPSAGTPWSRRRSVDYLIMAILVIVLINNTATVAAVGLGLIALLMIGEVVTVMRDEACRASLLAFQALDMVAHDGSTQPA